MLELFTSKGYANEGKAMNATQEKHEEFVSEPLVPVSGSFDASGMSRGEPGLPGRFSWRDRAYQVARLMSKWKSSGPSSCGETYLRRHWYRIETTTGERMTLYCQRQASHAKTAKMRWWIYSVTK